MQPKDMLNCELCAHMNDMAKSGIFSMIPPKSRAIYHETVKRVVSTYNTEQVDELVRRATVFFNDVLPQIGGLCIQDLGNVNELGLLLARMEKEAKEREVNLAES